VWTWIILLFICVVVVLAAASALHAALTRRKQYAEADALWRRTAEEDRVEALQAELDRSRHNAPAWYLLGVASLRRCHAKSAARAFGMAHHMDCRIETAVLLTFACLKSDDGEQSGILEQIISTWEEMHRPDVLQNREDRVLLQCLADTAGEPPPLSPLGRLAWLVTGPVHQQRFERLLAENDEPWTPFRPRASGR
jgi:hypothetical protein